MPRSSRPGETALIMFAVVGKLRGKHSFFVGKRLQAAAIKLDGKKLPLAWVILITAKENYVCRLVDSIHSQHFEVALGNLPLQIRFGLKRILLVEAVEIKMGVAVAPAKS